MSAPTHPVLDSSHVRFVRLAPEQCEKIHAASLTILERTGVRLYEPEAVELVRRAGAPVSEENRARIPAHLVEQALSTAPKRLTLYDRNGDPAMPVEGYRSFFGPGSDLLNIVDHRTGRRRKPTLQDVVDGITLCDALDTIDYVMSMFLPHDVNQVMADRYQMEVMLNRTTKPIAFVTYDTSGCLDAIEMAEAVAGGAAALAQKPFVVCYINVTTGLRHNPEALQKLLFLAGKGLPAMYVPVVSSGLSGPMTVPGAMACTYAGVLAGLVLSQLKRPGTPFVVPGWGAMALDMRTMVEPYTGPDYQGVAQAMARWYDLPTFTMGGASESKLPDQQAAFEAGLTLLVAVLAGGHIMHDVGYLESGLSGSLAQLAICDEMISYIKSCVSEIEVDDETLAVDLVDKIGPDGQYLETDHTTQHYRERWYPRLAERDNFGRWEAKGSKTMGQRAAERVDAILAEHRPQPLPEGVARAVHAVVERAEARFGRK